MVANITQPVINIPATIIPQLGQPAVTDSFGIGGVTAILGTAITYWQNHKDDSKQDNRTDKLSNAQLQLVDSLKATDQANKDHAQFISMTLDALAKHPELAKILNDPANGVGGKSVIELANENKEEWEKSFKQYYESKPTNPDTFSKDSVLAKVASVQQITQPSPTS